MKIKKITILSLVSALLINVVGQNLYYPVIAATSESNVQWTFDSDTEGWVYDDSWKGDSEITGSASYDATNQMLKVDVNFSQESGNDWAQTGISVSPEGGIDFSGYDTLSVDVYYDSEELSTGNITLAATAQNWETGVGLDNFVEQQKYIKEETNPAVEATGLGENVEKITITFECGNDELQRIVK